MGLFEDKGTGIYDFASDTMDNIGNGVSELNDMARSQIPGVREVEDAIHGAYDWGMDQLRSFEAYSEIEKRLERSLIRTLYVPAKKRAVARVIKEFDTGVQKVGQKAKTTIDSVNNQIDAEIKGEFSNAIQDTVSKENLKWEKLV
ncbi:hypothetical protein [Streptococcus oralis]|uniref:hypothetical protein n=1 Tax=Streptococcus oralis TaxID=1303 RepID=UPI000A1156F9|nr:hypothetical protein [Streptococcus oralis]MCY7072601.1 hypothetical protein [Streptococcus oralis]ORO74006.1 hypothetical protein B7710_02055 [Streptococcus oralis subsp. oralis]RSI74030.1 hypothetical protein D8859_06960 [Streptococcus oralis]